MLNAGNQAAASQTEPAVVSTENSTQAVNAPLLGNINAVDIAETSAAITWTTDIPADSMVEYWVKGTEVKKIIEDSVQSLDHRMDIFDLTGETEYEFMVSSKSSAGLQSTADTTGNFITTGKITMESPEVGYMAPYFSLEDMDGNIVSLADLRGKWVMLIFWETTCPTCREELPEFQSYSTRMPVDKIQMVTVNVKSVNDKLLLSYLLSKDITLPVLMDREGEVAKNYKIVQFPTSFFIDPDGIIRKVVDYRFGNTDAIAGTIISLIGN